MRTVGKSVWVFGLTLAHLTSSALPAQAPAMIDSFRTRLTTAPFQDQINAGDGQVTATLHGHVLSLAGRFDGLAAAATRVRLLSGGAVGVRGTVVVRDLPILAGDTAGKIWATVTLSAAQVMLLRAERLYIEVDTRTADDGALIGWLMPNHPFVGERVPEKQNWAAQ